MNFSNWIHCLNQESITGRFNFLDGNYTITNWPVNLDNCLTFKKSIYDMGKKKYPSIGFDFPNLYEQWVFETEEKRNKCYDDIIKTIFPKKPKPLDS